MTNGSIEADHLLLDQIQKRNSYPAKAGWNTALDHISSDALSIFCDISNYPSESYMIQFFDGLVLKTKNSCWFSELELLFPLLTEINQRSRTPRRYKKCGIYVEVWAYTGAQSKSTSSAHCLTSTLSDFYFSSKHFPKNVKRNCQITMHYILIHSREQTNNMVQNGLWTPAPGWLF